MKIVNRQPVETADASAERGTAFRELRRLTLLLIVIVLIIFLAVGWIVDLTVQHISFETEARLFSHRVWSNLAGEITTNDTRLAELQPILDKLKQDQRVPPLPYRLTLILNEKPNAFAFPGGAIGVTTGLLDAIGEDIELAFVLGHELGHFRYRAHLRGLGRAVGLGVVFAVLGGGELGADSVVRMMQLVLSRGYSRQQERRADRFGVELVSHAYGRADGVDRLFKILRRRDDVPDWTYMFATHPSPSDRIAELQAYAQSLEEDSANTP